MENLKSMEPKNKITSSDPPWRTFSASFCSLENCRESSQIFSPSDCVAVAVEARSYGGSSLRFVLRLGKAIRVISLFSTIIPLYHRLLEDVHSHQFCCLPCSQGWWLVRTNMDRQFGQWIRQWGGIITVAFPFVTVAPSVPFPFPFFLISLHLIQIPLSCPPFRLFLYCCEPCIQIYRSGDIFYCSYIWV